VNHLAAARNAVALTGAGISIESGIPPFRGKGGLWEKFDPMEIAHIDALIRDPARVWKVLVKDLKDIMDRAAPNDGHKGLARLEQMGILKTVITQNIDGLHQRAGSADVVELHGTMHSFRCVHGRHAGYRWDDFAGQEAKPPRWERSRTGLDFRFPKAMS